MNETQLSILDDPIPKVNLLGIPISRLGLEESILYCRSHLLDQKKDAAHSKSRSVCFVNVHTLTEASSNSRLKNILEQAFLAAADGAPLRWAARKKNAPVQSRICGPDFMHAVLTRYPHDHHAFIGGAPSQAQALIQRFHLKNTTFYSPPIRPFSEENAKEDWEKFLEKKDPSLETLPLWIWVGLGAPKQEYWMQTISPLTSHGLFFGVGAAFDFLAGTKSRAPHWMQEHGLEWVFRFSQEPNRLWKRYLHTNSIFMIKMGSELLREKIKPCPKHKANTD